jgi:hypothetical protein
MISKLEKCKPGSIVCDIDDPKKIYEVIQHKTIFSGFDVSGDLAYGQSKTIARLRLVGPSSRVYRFDINKKMVFLGHCPA